MKSLNETLSKLPQKQNRNDLTLRITKDQFLNDYNLTNIQKLCRKANTIPKVFESSTPTIGIIKRTYGEDFTSAYIETWIVNIREFMNLGKNMNPEQMNETAYMIMDEYPFLTLADINLVFKRAKMGEYGNLYDRLDGSIIMGWFKTYFTHRLEAAEAESIRQAGTYKPRSMQNTRSGQTKKVDEITNTEIPSIKHKQNNKR